MVSKQVTEQLNTFTLQLSQHLSETVQGAVKFHINGKIDALTNKVDEYIKADNVWKKEAQPVIDFYEHMSFSKKFLMGGVVALSAMIGLVVAIKNLLK